MSDNIKIKIVSKGDEKIQLKGYNGKTSTTNPKKLTVKNPGGAQIVIHERMANGKIVSQTRHLKFSNGNWTDAKGNSYRLEK